MKVVDTRGEKCPKPIIETKKALKETEAGEIFRVLTDNKTSFLNISRFLTDNGITYTVSEANGTWVFEVNNDKGNTETKPAEDYCINRSTAGSGDSYAVSVSSEFMGQGDDILGRKLMKSFFVALSVLDVLPSLMVFYNSGVKLAVEGSDVVDLLKEIETKGTEIILCGTCIDHYGLGGKTGAGTIGDMYLIMQKLAAAGKVIKP